MVPAVSMAPIPEEMLALRWWNRLDIRLDTIPTPRQIPPGWVLVEVEACGICGTDLEEYQDGPIVVPTITPHPLTGALAPVTLGHEVVGRVADLGGLSTCETDLRLGQRVAIEGNLFCGECFWCLRHEFPLCVTLGSLGQMADGGLAQFMVAPAYMCLPMSDSLPAAQAVLVEPLAVVLRALRRAGDITGTNIAIFGAGTLGLLALQAALAGGAGEVVMIDPLPGRRQLALDLGASLAISPDETDVLTTRYEADGPDLILECAGSVRAAEAAVRHVRRGGTALLLGVKNADFRIPMLEFVLGQKTVTSSISHVWDEDFPPAIELLTSGVINATALITAVVPLSRALEDGLGALGTDPSRHIKIVIVPDPVVEPTPAGALR